MALYLIPSANIADLTKKIKRIQNKGADITFNIGEEGEVEVALSINKTIVIKAHSVEVEGKYLINGWRFVGTIEHSEVGNILRVIDSELEPHVPAKYRTIGQECEHCQRVRDRKDTYLIYNEETKEFKQVGKTCLRGYTGGLDAGLCSRMAETINNLEEAETSLASVDKMYQDFMHSYSKGANWYGIPTDEVKKISYTYVKHNGYFPKDTAAEVGKYLFGRSNIEEKIIPATAAEIEEMTAWLNSKDTKSGYMRNAKIAWTKSSAEYRDVALIASLVSVYLKDKGEAVKREAAIKNERTNEYVGNISEKIILSSIATIRVLYIKDGGNYGYNAPSTYVYEIIDKEGHTYVWSSSYYGLEEEVETIESITATIKDHKEYKGLKQTIITRGKVTKKSPN